MSCPLEPRVLHLGAGPLAKAERRALIAHAQECPQCAGALDEVATAREVLKEGRRSPHPSARVRVWAGIEAKRRRAPSLMPPWGFVAAGAAAAALLVFARLPTSEAVTPRLERGQLTADGVAVKAGQALPKRAELVAEGPVRIMTIGAELELAPETALRLVQSGAEVSVDLTTGELSVSTLPAVSAVRVQTQAVGVTILAGHVTLRADGDLATVRVDRGRARAEVPGATTAPEPLETGAERSYGTRPKRRSSAAPPRAKSLRRASTERRRAPAPRRPATDTRDDAKSLEAARAVLPAAPKRARAMAQEVLARRPEARLEVGALALIADAERRSGRLRDALRSYQQVVDHRRGGSYAEEALFRQASLHDRLGEARDALAKLEVGERRFAGGVLAPERAELEAKLYLAAGRPKDAASALERVPEAARSLAIARRRVEVAEALWGADPARAAQLAAPALAAPDPELRRRAANLMPPGGRVRGDEITPSRPNPKTQ